MAERDITLRIAVEGGDAEREIDRLRDRLGGGGGVSGGSGRPGRGETPIPGRGGGGRGGSGGGGGMSVSQAAQLIAAVTLFSRAIGQMGGIVKAFTDSASDYVIGKTIPDRLLAASDTRNTTLADFADLGIGAEGMSDEQVLGLIRPHMKFNERDAAQRVRVRNLVGQEFIAQHPDESAAMFSAMAAYMTAKTLGLGAGR